MQLIETPTIQPEINSSAYVHLSYALKVFQHDSSCITVTNYRFTDNMVPISLETFLPARNLFEQLLARPSAFALEPCSQSFEFKPVSQDYELRDSAYHRLNLLNLSL